MPDLKEQLAKMTPEERAYVMKVLKDPEKINALYDADYWERPVSIDEFLENPDYLGWATDNGKNIYPYWRDRMREIFDESKDFSEVALTGCLSGDTIIPLLNGKKISMKDLSDIGELDEYVYSFDVDKNEYVPGHLIKAFSTGIKKVYRIYLDNGEWIDATSNHRFMTRDKHWKSIDTGLSAGDSLMPFNTGFKQVMEGRGFYQVVYHPQKDGSCIEEFTHRAVMRNKVGRYKGVVHHKDFDKLNNDPRNLLVADFLPHRKYHAKKGGIQFREFNEKVRNNELDENTFERLQECRLKGTLNRWSLEENHRKASEVTSRRMYGGQAKEMAQWALEKPGEIERRSNYMSKRNSNCDMIKSQQGANIAHIANIALTEFGGVTEETFNAVRKKYNFKSGYPSFESATKRFTMDEIFDMAKNYNHRVIDVEFLGEQEVYDLTVEKYHNFATNCGIVAHNSIGCGKSHIAVLCLIYFLYKIMCLKDPAAYFNLSKGSPIYIVFLNLTITLSEGVAFSKFNNILLGSPWFMRHGKQSQSLKKPEYIPDGNIKFTAGSQVSHVIGKDCIAAIMDELNFGRGSAAASLEKNQIMNLYNNIVERIRSRFIVDGRCKGKMFLVSSKKAESDFLESYIKKQKDNPSVKVCDAVLWKIKPTGTYSGKKFKVAFAGINMPPKIIREEQGETEDEYIRMGYNIEEVPVEFKGSFELDILAALNNVCGIVISDVTKFMTYDNLSKCYNPSINNPFRQEVITIGCKDKLQLRDFYDPSVVPEEISSMPLFIHMDCSINGDKTGISCVAVLGFKYENRYDVVSNTSTPTKELCFRHVFSVALQAPMGDEISFQKSREFLYYLKFELGYNIKAVSTDGFQSYDLRQQLTAMGFSDVSLVSLDRKPDGYLCLRNAINEKRVMMLPNTPNLEHELINLERDNQTGKVDHPMDGAKDESDSLAGAIFNANEHLEDFTFATAEVFKDALTQNVEESQLSQDREMLLASLVTPLSQVRSDNMSPNEKKNSRQAFYDFNDMEDSMLIF